MIHYYMNKYPHYQIINIDYNTDAANPDNIECPDQADRYAFHRVDIRNAHAISHLFELYDITDIIHFAAETRSMERVGEIRLYEQTNVLGTMNLLHAAQNAWMFGPHQPNPNYAGSRFHQLSLAEAKDNSLYSDSKQRADAMIQNFYEESGLGIVTTATPESFGPRQQEDEQVPKFIRQALEGELTLPDSGPPHDWLFVGDLCEAIDTVFHLGDAGQRYTIGYSARLDDWEFSRQIIAAVNAYFLGNDKDQVKPVRPPVQQQVLGFAPFTPFEEALRMTTEWYIKKYQYADFMRKQ